jgi:uridine kinase
MTTPRARSCVIAIAGGSGAGKSWLVRQFCRILGPAAGHLSLDDFYRDRSHLPMARRARVNFDVPRAIDWDEAARVVRDCREGRATELARYDFATYSRCADRATWVPTPVVFIEGLWVLRPAALRPLFDLKIYLDAPAKLRHDRRIARDTVERGYQTGEVQERLLNMVLPMHERYVEPQRRWADIVLTHPYREADIVALADQLWPLLRSVEALPSWMPATFRAELLSLLVEHEYAH